MAKSETNSEDEPKKKGSGGGFIGLVILALGSLASAFGTVYLLTPEPAIAVAACPPTDAAQPTPPVLATGEKEYVALQEVLITIGSAPATRYLKMQISVVADKKESDTIREAEPVLIDAFVSYLRSVELSDFENPAFYTEMRSQLSRRAELVVGGDVSDGVLITEFLLR